MNTKKLIISTAVIFIIYVISDFVFYTYIFPDRFLSKVLRTEPFILWVFLGLFVASFMFSYLFSKMAKGKNKTQEGIKYGLSLGIFMYIPLFLIFYGTRDLRPLAGWLTNAVFHIIQFGIFGIVVSHISMEDASETSAAND